MDRRHFLALSGTALTAGCSGLVDDSGREPFTVETTAEPETTSPTATETVDTTDRPANRGELSPVDGGRFESSVVDFETGNRTVALTPTMAYVPDGLSVRAQFDATATADGPARFRVTVENTREWVEHDHTYQIPLFDPRGLALRIDSATGPRGRETLAYVPTENHPLAATTPSYERSDDGFWRLTENAREWLETSLKLGPGATITGEYFLLQHPDESGLTPGVYRRADDRPAFVVWETDAPGIEVQSRFAGETVPRLWTDAATNWYHETDRSTPVFVQPSTEAETLPARVDFDLRNHSKRTLNGNEYFWQLFKLHEGSWKHLRFGAIPSTSRPLPAGQSMDWSLYAFHGPAVATDEGEDVGYLGGGTYAFSTGYKSEEAVATPTALVEFDAPDVTVEPESDIETTRDGDTVTVETPTFDADSDPIFVVETAESGDGTLIAEQIMQLGMLRNALPYLNETGARRVEVRGSGHPMLPTFAQTDQYRFTYDGSAYRLFEQSDEQT
ncbi:hypothetical protein [Haloarchaeobius sp. DFWS5]|uniref:hypothetical protein n=1 Tax=Haloarchaeobius sp. DFWS5 TaxID=3446114 RepID=UPI003EBDDB72